MQVTKILTRQLRNDFPLWTSCSLPGGRNSPLVRSGVLVYGELLSYIECKCSDCDFLPTPFIRNEGAPNPQWAITCEMSGETIDVDEDEVHDWRYNADKFAAIVSDRLECEGVEKINDNLWRLGHSRIPETEGREIVIATRFRESDTESIDEYIDGQGFILLVGSMECDVQDDQFRRRIYTFDQVVRFQADGTMEFVLDEFTNRLEERVGARKRKHRTDSLQREHKIAEYLKNRFFQILAIDDYSATLKALDEMRNVSKIGKNLRIPKNSMSRYLAAKWSPGDAETIAQFWYNVVTRLDFFESFSVVVKRLNRSVCKLSAEELYNKFYRLFLAEQLIKQKEGE